jgi:protein-tyrosine kinase
VNADTSDRATSPPSIDRGAQPSTPSRGIAWRGRGSAYLERWRGSPNLAEVLRTAERAVRSVVDRHELITRQPLPRSIAVVGAMPGDGVSTVAQALVSVVAADFGARVCLIDLNATEVGEEAGAEAPDTMGTMSQDLRDVLSGDLPIELFLRSTDQPGVVMLSIGDLFPQPVHGIARSVEFEELFKRILSDLDYIVFDTPPLRSDNESLALLRHADAYLLVARHGRTTIGDVRDLTSQLASVPCIGAILNDAHTRTPRYIRRLFDG